MEIPVMMTVDEVADYLKVSHMTVRRLIDRKELKAKKIGRCVRIKQSDLAEFLCA